ncbi:MAG: hypothetical protein J6S83_05465 [Lachnospiraceae bacterium]|nr:hypothetical protein [Lachnospiraceae bacterium]
MIALLLFLILAVMVIAIVGHMTLYVAGGVIGLILAAVFIIIKRRSRK